MCIDRVSGLNSTDVGVKAKSVAREIRVLVKFGAQEVDLGYWIAKRSHEKIAKLLEQGKGFILLDMNQRFLSVRNVRAPMMECITKR